MHLFRASVAHPRLWRPVVAAAGFLLYAAAFGAGSFRVELERVHGLIAERRYPEAHAALVRDLASLAGRPAERALMLEARGTVEAAMGRFSEAVDTLLRCRQLEGDLPPASRRRILFLLGQIQLRTKDYAAAAEALEAWLRQTERATPEAHLLLGSAYLGLGRYAAGIAQLEQARNLAQSLSEGWARQLAAAYQQAGRPREAAVLLRELLTNHPDRPADWLQLATLELALDAPVEALAILEMTERRGWLTDESQLLELAQLQVALGTPYRAARLLDRALAQGRIAATERNQRLLIDAWRQAHEIERAYAVCLAATRTWQDPKLYRLAAELALELGRWDAAVAAAERALGAADGVLAAEVNLLLGIALASLERWPAAQTALAGAIAAPEVAPRATVWLRYVEQMLEPTAPGAG